ncbi:hypothetical protein Ahy_A06g029524 [Arachis hypogaea]|uniref:Uncharacterized protein n=1 Tax=Arachis hypogaea TaxID=3818 RepID=A0A445CTQ3_ARAHY|nr:hypothetical protein Ahy_A06g029524 [Arachis hypogaea]
MVSFLQKSLTSFHLSNNQLGGNIPLEIEILDSICDVNLSSNKLEGLIPSPMLNCISFGEVDLSNNLLSGNILSKIDYVKKLNRRLNLLSGSVPFLSIKDGPYIRETKSIFFIYNNLIGNLPIELASIPHINFSFNFFECPQGCKYFYAKSMICNTPISKHQKIKAPRYNFSFHKLFFPPYQFCGYILFYSAHEEVEDIIEATQDFNIRCYIETLTYDNINFTNGSHKIHLLTKAFETRLRCCHKFVIETLSNSMDCVSTIGVKLEQEGGYHYRNSIPFEIGALVSLQELYIEFNQINGSILSEFQNLINLLILHLSHNMISEIGILDSLCDANLSNNKLEGLIPSPVLNCISFGEVDLSNNLLSENIPSKIGHVKKLDRSHNLLNGSVPFLCIKDDPYILGKKSFFYQVWILATIISLEIFL